MQEKFTFGTDKNARQGKKALRVLKVKVKHILWLKKRVHTFVSDGELLGAFNASSKRRDRYFLQDRQI